MILGTKHGRRVIPGNLFVPSCSPQDTRGKRGAQLKESSLLRGGLIGSIASFVFEKFWKEYDTTACSCLPHLPRQVHNRPGVLHLGVDPMDTVPEVWRNWNGMRYRQVYDGDWVKPVMRNYLMKCCTCCSVHRMDFRVIRWGRGFKVLFRARAVQGRRKRL